MSEDSMAPERPAWRFAEFTAAIGSKTVSAWEGIPQTRIDEFARCSGDDAFIHTDPARAAATRFGGTIAHGLLTLSLLPKMLWSATARVSDARMSVNYGFDKVRFLTPVPVNSRLRGHFTLQAAAFERPGFGKIRHSVSVEIEGLKAPALAAEWIIGHWIS